MDVLKINDDDDDDDDDVKFLSCFILHCRSVGPKVMVPSVKLQGPPTSIGSDTIAKKSVYAPSKSRSQIKSMPGKRIGLPVLMEKAMPADIRVIVNSIHLFPTSVVRS